MSNPKLFFSVTAELNIAKGYRPRLRMLHHPNQLTMMMMKNELTLPWR